MLFVFFRLGLQTLKMPLVNQFHSPNHTVRFLTGEQRTGYPEAGEQRKEHALISECSVQHEDPCHSGWEQSMGYQAVVEQGTGCPAAGEQRTGVITHHLNVLFSMRTHITAAGEPRKGVPTLSALLCFPFYSFLSPSPWDGNTYILGILLMHTVLTNKPTTIKTPLQLATPRGVPQHPG